MRFDRPGSYFYVIIFTAFAPPPSGRNNARENGRGINEGRKSFRHIDIGDVSSDDTRSYLRDSKMRIYCGRSTARDFA